MAISDYLDAALGEGTAHYTSKGLQYSYDCPFCGDTRERLFINVDRQLFHCHNCDTSGTIVTFLSMHSHISWKDALKVYRDYEGYERPLSEDLEQEVYSKLFKQEIVIEKYVHPLPEEFIPIAQARGKSGQKAVDYIISRGISMNTAIEQNLGYCAEGKYANRIILPDYEDGELVYWQSRTWLPTPKDPAQKKRFRKVLNPSLTKEQVEDGMVSIDKSEVVSNIDGAKKYRMAVVTEGRFDALTIPNVGVCTHGKSMSDDQFMKLVTNKDNIDIVAVMYDGDAFKYTVNTAKRLYQHFNDVLVCKLPEDEDPNSLGTKRCLEILEQGIMFSPLLEVKMKLKGWI